ncbi:MAG TPA: hypothetical protein VE776_09590 [Actinomycetota bacterium]|jgi:hypothetical protein|nr:hypothetical protein [Actinomycetota bacterium]
MPPKPSRTAGQTRRTGRARPSGPDPLDLAERLFGPDPGQDPRPRDGDEPRRVRSEPLWVRLLGFELPWHRRKRRL